MKLQPPTHRTTAIAAAAVFSLAMPLVAEPEGTGEKPPAISTWKDLGFDEAPDAYPTGQIPLFAALDKARGSWTFEGSSDGGQVDGALLVSGGFQGGRIPMWNLSLGWPAERPQQLIRYVVMASPEPEGFELVLVRTGPFKPDDLSRPEPALFRGEWDRDAGKVAWEGISKSDLLPGLQDGAETGPAKRERLEMTVLETGAISIDSRGQAPAQRHFTATAVERTGKAPLPAVAPKQASYASTDAVLDQRLKRCLPPAAKRIKTRMERGGHFARYEVPEAEFHQFLDSLWEAAKDTSAHRRDEMHGEGEAVARKEIEQRFAAFGWKPLGDAVRYYSPSKSSGAMTTYYFDRKAGVAYHDTGYW